MKTLIQKLVETMSPSGYEAAIREVVKAEIRHMSMTFMVISKRSWPKNKIL